MGQVGLYIRGSQWYTCCFDWLSAGADPQDISTGQYAGQKGSPLTEWIKGYRTDYEGGRTDWFARWARELEKECNVPYDAMSYTLEHLEKINDAGWNELEINSVKLLEIVTDIEFPVIKLGSID